MEVFHTTSDFNIAVHALVYLENKGDDLTSSDELSQYIGTHPVRVRRVMIKLKEAGMIITKAGVSGGYHINHDASPITLSRVAKALIDDYVHVTWHNSEDREKIENTALSHVIDNLFMQMNDACDQVLQQTTIEDIAREIR